MKEKYTLNTYLTLWGVWKLIEVPDQGWYGKWVLYLDRQPKYLISCFDEHSESDMIITRLIESKRETLESIVCKIYKNEGVKLVNGFFPWFGIKTKSEFVDMDIPPLPTDWLKKIEANG